MNKKIKLFVFLFCLSSGSILAQSIQVLMSPKPSPYISDWQQQTETVKLVISNPTSNDILVKINTELFDGKGSLIANTDVSKMPVLTVPPGVSTYNAEDIIPGNAVNYKGGMEKTAITTGRIPDDNYKLCVNLVNPKTEAPMGTSGTVCKMFTIVAYQAPTLIVPANNSVIAETGVKGIVFRWSPVIPSSKTVVTYRLQVWEVLEGQNSMTALRSNQPIVEKDLKGILQTQWPIDFELPKLKTGSANHINEWPVLVWTITPLDGEGRKLVDGNGFAEPFTFKIGSNNNGQVKLRGPDSSDKLFESKPITFKWEDIGSTGPYTLRIVELKGNESPETAINNQPYILVEGIKTTSYTYPPPDRKLKGGKKYVWQVSNKESKSEVRTFSIRSEILISYKLQVECSDTPGYYNFLLKVDNMNSYAVNLVSLSINSTIPTSSSGMISPASFPIVLPVGVSTISGTINSGVTAITTLCLRPKVEGPAPDEAVHEINVCADSIAMCLCRECDSLQLDTSNFHITQSGTNGEYNITGNLTANRPIYGLEFQVHSYSYTAAPATCTNGVNNLEQSGVFLVPASTVNGSPVLIYNETSSGSSGTNNNASKIIVYKTPTALTGNIPVNLSVGLPTSLAGLKPECCKINYQVCIKVRVYYDPKSCKSCTYRYCYNFTNQ